MESGMIPNILSIAGSDPSGGAGIQADITAIREDIRIDAVKIGMLGSAEAVTAVLTALHGLNAPIVLDPVMVAKSGDRLLHADAVAALRDHFGSACVITPNLPEAADLLNQPEARSSEEMEAQARALLDLNRLLKKAGLDAVSR